MTHGELMWNKVHTLNFRATLHIGPGAVKKIKDVANMLKSKEISSVLVVASQNAYKVSGAWDHVRRALVDAGIGWTIYDRVTANPTDVQVDEAAALGRHASAQAVIGIGGGSPIDTAKGAAILIRHPDRTARQMYYREFEPTGAVPIIAVNTTHGTGTEVDRFAVATMPESRHKLGMGFGFTYPVVGIDDPELMRTLPARQALFTTIDALAHAYESATTRTTTPYTIMLSEETFRTAARFLPDILDNPEDMRARFHLAYGAAMAGVAFDIGALHIIHAMEHPLSAHKPEIAHGQGLGMLFGAVVRRVYRAAPEVSAALLRHIVPGLRPTAVDADRAATGLESWMRSLGLTETLRDFGFDSRSLEELAAFTWNVPAHRNLMKLAPIQVNPDIVREIYLESLEPYS